MSNASERNFAIAQRERSRRLAMAADDPSDTISAQAAVGDPGWNAFFGALREKGEGANAAGYGFRADLSGLGRPAQLGAFASNGMEVHPADIRSAQGIAANVGLGQLADQTHAVQRAEQGFDDARMDQIVGSLQNSYDQSRLDSAYAPPEEPTNISASADGSKVTMRPAGPPLSDRERILRSIPGHVRPEIDKLFSDLDTAKTGRDVTAGNFALNVQKERAAEGSNPLLGSGGAMAGPDGQPLQGADVMKRLAPPVRAQVQAILDGRQALPSGTATKDPYWKSIMTLAQQVDPTFDAVDYNSRYKTRQDFTSGPTANQITAINTVIGHLSHFSDAVDKIGNGSYNFVNNLENKVTPGGSSRGVALNNFNTLKNGVTSELTRVWRQAGGTEQDIKDWSSTIGDTKSPEELHGALNTIGGMLESKLTALQDRYRQGMGTNAVSVIPDDVRGHLDKLQGRGGAAGAAQQRAIPGIPGGLAELRDGKWVRVK